MKILLAVMLSPCSSNQDSWVSIVFAYAWASFYRKNKSKLLCDVKFFNHNHDKELIDKSLRNCPVHNYMMTTYHSGIANEVLRKSSEYDYVILCEHDSFLTVECINNICSSLSENKDIDFATVSTTRSWWGLQEIDRNLFVPPLEYPWNILQTSTGLIILKVGLYKKALKKFKSLGLKHPIPFNSNSLTYKEICKFLKKEPRKEISDDCKMGLDGPFSVDFWTCLNICNPTTGLIVNHNNGSLLAKTRVVNGKQIEDFKKFNNIIDEKPLEETADFKIVAPFFHLGGGHTIQNYWTDVADSHIKFSLAGLSENMIGNAITHYCIVQYLVQHSEDKKLKDGFFSKQTRIFNLLGIDKFEFKNKFEKIKKFYKEQLNDYTK